MAEAPPDPAATPPGVAVIIPHLDDAGRLRHCLAALTAGNPAGIEIVVVDNGSATPLDPLRVAFPSVRFLVECEPGAGPARNRGVAATTAPLLCFTDADCLPAPDWLATARRLASSADLIGGRVDMFDETPPPRSGAQAFEAVFAFRCRDYVERQGFAVTANLVTRREVFLATGGFRAGLAEDRDWCRRARALGFRIAYADALRVAHPTRADWPSLRRKWLRLTREAWAGRPHGLAGRARWALRALATAASALPDLPKMLSAPGLAGAERRRGAAVLLRQRLIRAGWMLRQALGLDP